MGGHPPPSDLPPSLSLFKLYAANTYQLPQLDGNMSVNSGILENKSEEETLGHLSHVPQKVLETKLEQLDGNISLCSSISNESTLSSFICSSSDKNCNIPVQIGDRSAKVPYQERLPPVRRVIKRSNKVLQAASFPKFSSYNMRSLVPKICSLGADMLDRQCSLSFLVEIWQKTESKKHQFKIEELFEMRGIKYISTPRPGNRRGGGAAIAANSENFTLTKLNIFIPNNLEVVWGLLKPSFVSGKVNKIIVCSFYCPPKSKKKTALIDHLTFTVQSLRITFPSAGLIISGDRNDLSDEKLKTVDPSLKQIVRKETRGNKVLTVVLTDLEAFYEEPVIVPPIEVDDIAKGGVQSDHNGVVVSPISDKPFKRTKLVKKIRPIPQSSLDKIGQVLTNETWKFMDQSLSSTQLVDLFEFYSGGVLDIFCPEKLVHYRADEKPFITEKMKIMKRNIMREYDRKGKSDRYFQLKSIFKGELDKQVSKYKEKIMEDVRNGDRSSSYAALRKLGVRPGDNLRNTFDLPAHSNLSIDESVERIADHFAAISNEYTPINMENFPPKIRETLSNPDMNLIPQLEEYQVYKKISQAKKPNSIVPGDIPKKVIKEFSCELSVPVTRIFNSILQSLEYPRQWVIEYQVPIPKINPPDNEDDLRNIAKTSFASKVFESFLSDWLMPIVGPYIDPCQYGLKGASISHYLIKLLKFIHEHLDLKEPHAVVVAMVDLSKAFNRVSHSMVIEDLHDMHVPSWLLLILFSYLTGRSMILTYKGASSSPRSLPGSSPQGAFLGIFFFIIKYNAAALRPRIPRPPVMYECHNNLAKCSKNKDDCTKHPRDTHALFVDDLSEAEAINLKKQLVNDTSVRSYPLTFHERTRQILPPGSRLQTNLLKIEHFTKQNQMKINEDKSKIMIFNKSRMYDFPPEFHFSNGVNLECLEVSKLLGIQLHSSLSWFSNTAYIYSKSMRRMWLLRRMKVLKLDPSTIFEYYIKEIRPLTEQGVIVWNSSLTKGQERTLEKIQKVALKIILGQNYISYEVACYQFNITNLKERRAKLCENLAIKLFKSSRRDEFFTLANQNRHNLVRENICRTRRCYNAPHNYLNRLVNKNRTRIGRK